MLLEKLKTLKTLLGENELILTGSTALAYHGLMELSDCKDLDLIILNPSAASTEVLNRLQADNASPKHHDQSPVSYSFFYEGIKVDVWITTSHEDKQYLISPDGVKVASVKSIINAKLSYNRAKDWVQLMQISRKIYNPKKFEEQLYTIKTVSDDEYPEETTTPAPSKK